MEAGSLTLIFLGFPVTSTWTGFICPNESLVILWPVDTHAQPHTNIQTSNDSFHFSVSLTKTCRTSSVEMICFSVILTHVLIFQEGIAHIILFFFCCGTENRTDSCSVLACDNLFKIQNMPQNSLNKTWCYFWFTALFSCLQPLAILNFWGLTSTAPFLIK